MDQLAGLAHNGDPGAIATITSIGQEAGLTSQEVNELIDAGVVEFNAAEVAAARLLVVELNEEIEEVVDALSNSNFTYVDPLAAGSPFAGHELCTETPYFNGLVIPPNDEYSFHPNEAGQDAYRQLLAGVA